MSAECALCAADNGHYNWNNVCCRARYITSIPMVNSRRGWMALWKQRESAEFYAQIELAVTALWKNKQ